MNDSATIEQPAGSAIRHTVNIIIEGRSATGKSAAAQLIHQALIASDIAVSIKDDTPARSPDKLSLALDAIAKKTCFEIEVRPKAREDAVGAPPSDDGWEWCFLEIMGHRSHWGRSREEERFGAKMIRIDVPIEGDPVKGWTTHYYGGASIFSYSLTDEATVMRRNKPYMPPSRLSLAAPDDDVPFDDGQLEGADD